MKGPHPGSRKVTLLFLIGGAVSAIVFGSIITRPSLEALWFAKIEWWIFPTRKFWFLSSGLFLLAFAASYALSILKGWLRPARWYRIVCALAVTTAIPIVLFRFSRPTTATIGIFLSPSVVTLCLSAAMFVLTKRWLGWASGGIFLIYFAAPLLAGISDIFARGGSKWFDVLTFFIRSSGLMALCGWWLGNTTDSHQGESVS